MTTEEKDIKTYKKNLWKAGQSGNPKGRKKGSKNKFTDLKSAFVGFMEKTNGTEGIMKWVYQPEVIRDFDGEVIKLIDHSAERMEVLYKILGSMCRTDTEKQNITVNMLQSIKIDDKELNINVGTSTTAVNTTKVTTARYEI